MFWFGVYLDIFGNCFILASHGGPAKSVTFLFEVVFILCLWLAEAAKNMSSRFLIGLFWLIGFFFFFFLPKLISGKD